MGKSTFFNRMIGERQAIIDDTAGVTRDRQYGTTDWNGKTFTVVDTGGFVLSSDDVFETAIRSQVKIAIEEAAVIVFMVDVLTGVTDLDEEVAQMLRQTEKPVFLVVNKVDILHEGDIAKVRGFVVENAIKLLGVEPQIFLVSAKLAQRAKFANQQTNLPLTPSSSLPQPTILELWSVSRFEPLERYILDTLDQQERLRLKLLNPLGVAGRLRDKYAGITATRLEILGDDFTTIDTVEVDLAAFEEDMRRDFQYRVGQIDAILYAMADRGIAFIDQWLRIARVFDLANSAKVREAFEREVVADTNVLLERQINDLIDWMVEREHRQWQAVMSYLNRRADLHKDRVIGEVGGSFESNRRALLEVVRRDTQRAIGGFDHQAEAAKLAESVQTALAQTALVEVGALGLGALLVAALHTLVLDLTGLLFAGALAAVGLYVLPNRRRKARDELRAKVADLQNRLHEALSSQFEQELSRSQQAMQEAIQPYTRFIRSEREKLTVIAGNLGEIEQEMRTLRAKIDAL